MSLPLPKPGRPSYRNWGKLTNLIQPDWSITQDQYGLLQGTLTEVWDADAYGDVIIRAVGSPHPLAKDLSAYKSSSSFSKNGKAMVTTDYIGLKTDPTKPEWDLSSSTAETNILFHPRIEEFAVLKKGTGDNPISNGLVWKAWVDFEKDTHKFKGFLVGAPGGLGGVSKYLIPRASIKYSFYTKKLNTVQKFVANLATTSSQPLYGPKDVLPITPANFLLQSVGVTPFGEVYKISCEWQLSEHGVPWNKEVYPAFGSQSSGSGGYNNNKPPTPL